MSTSKIIINYNTDPVLNPDASQVLYGVENGNIRKYQEGDFSVLLNNVISNVTLNKNGQIVLYIRPFDEDDIKVFNLRKNRLIAEQERQHIITNVNGQQFFRPKVDYNNNDNVNRVDKNFDNTKEYMNTDTDTIKEIIDKETEIFNQKISIIESVDRQIKY
jgi:hypothetical protein